MGSITITVIRDDPAFTGERSYNISDANLGRLVAWAQVHFGTPGNPLGQVEALNAWVDNFINNTKASVVQYEFTKAQDEVLPPDDLGTALQ